MIIGAGAFLAVFLGAYIFVVIPSGRSWQRKLSAGLFVIIVIVVYGFSIELLGRPKPMWFEFWRDAAKARILGATMREGEAIYVWLQFSDSSEPRSYVLPWDMKMAQQLQNAMQEGQAKGTDVNMSKPFEAGLDDREPKFYATPQQALPDKDYQSSVPIVIEPSTGQTMGDHL